MIRTQIYLQEDQKAELEALSVQTQRPVAEIIREAVSRYLVDKKADVLDLLEGARGIWDDRTELDAVQYPETLRKQMDAHREEKPE